MIMCVQGFVRKALESKITAGLLLGAATGLLVTAATAGSEAWTQVRLAPPICCVEFKSIARAAYFN